MPGSYAARQPPAEKGEKPVTVLVTGFGPFLSKFPRNSSWEIASALPALIPASSNNPTPIHIHVYHEPIRVTYERVVELVPKLLTPASPLCPQPDIVLHIGLAAGRKFFALEQGSSGQGYDKIPDVDGKRFPNSSMEAKFPPSEFPDALNTSFDTSDVVARWKKELGYSSAEGNAEIEGLPDVQLSFDAGNFLCGFIYYNSLAHYFSIKEDERPVAFMHVPDLSYSDEKTQEGQEVAIALIKALVESRRKHGVVRQSQETISDESLVDKMDNNFA